MANSAQASLLMQSVYSLLQGPSMVQLAHASQSSSSQLCGPPEELLCPELPELDEEEELDELLLEELCAEEDEDVALGPEALDELDVKMPAADDVALLEVSAELATDSFAGSPPAPPAPRWSTLAIPPQADSAAVARRTLFNTTEAGETSARQSILRLWRRLPFRATVAGCSSRALRAVAMFKVQRSPVRFAEWRLPHWLPCRR